jgi:hypothetical protein
MLSSKFERTTLPALPALDPDLRHDASSPFANAADAGEPTLTALPSPGPDSRTPSHPQPSSPRLRLERWTDDIDGPEGLGVYHPRLGGDGSPDVS